jgi:hypothetical protein
MPSPHPPFYLLCWTVRRGDGGTSTRYLQNTYYPIGSGPSWTTSPWEATRYVSLDDLRAWAVKLAAEGTISDTYWIEMVTRERV